DQCPLGERVLAHRPAPGGMGTRRRARVRLLSCGAHGLQGTHRGLSVSPRLQLRCAPRSRAMGATRASHELRSRQPAASPVPPGRYETRTRFGAAHAITASPRALTASAGGLNTSVPSAVSVRASVQPRLAVQSDSMTTPAVVPRPSGAYSQTAVARPRRSRATVGALTTDCGASAGLAEKSGVAAPQPFADT